MTHQLKLREEFAEAVFSGDKCFEVRENDRGFQKGDHVIFTVVSKNGIPHTYHKLHEKRYLITYVLNGWGIEDGYVVFGMKEDS